MTGGKFKISLCKLFHNTPHAPIKYWCYGASFLDKARRYLSRPSLDGRSGLEQIKGDTAGISIFRFRWFEPLWYYNLALSFPTDKMEPVFF